jgi:hypothetical protein
VPREHEALRVSDMAGYRLNHGGTVPQQVISGSERTTVPVVMVNSFDHSICLALIHVAVGEPTLTVLAGCRPLTARQGLSAQNVLSLLISGPGM